MYWFIFSIIALSIISLAVNIAFGFRFIWRAETSRFRSMAQNGALSLFSFLFVLILLEIFFKVFFVQSDGFGYTLANQNWYERHWQPNSLGYRDREWTPEMLAGRTKIMVLGDSFVAGVGIDDPADRFSDLLGQMLGGEYIVMNVGESGAGTKDEIVNAIDYPYRPDVTILSFYINDIEPTAKDMGFGRPSLSIARPAIVDYSYALNFFYWRLFRLKRQQVSDNYWTWLFGVYNNPDVWQIYQRELLQVYQLTHERDIQSIVVIFPHLLAIEHSRPITSQVARLYAQQGVPVVDVTELVADKKPTKLIVNPVDSHPNEFVHRLVAEALYQIILDK